MSCLCSQEHRSSSLAQEHRSSSLSQEHRCSSMARFEREGTVPLGISTTEEGMRNASAEKFLAGRLPPHARRRAVDSVSLGLLSKSLSSLVYS